MEYKFKFIRKPLHVLAGLSWYFSAIIHIGLIIFFYATGISKSGLSFLVPMHLFIVILSALMATYFFRIDKRDYIRINSNTMSIENGLVRKRKQVKIENIEKTKEIGSKLRIGLKSGSDIKIDLELLSLKDITNLYNVLGV